VPFTAERAEIAGERFLKVMARRSGVFTRRGDIYGFIHPTFREYLAACDVVRESKRDDAYNLEQVWQRVVSRWADQNWREVALFVLSVLSDEDHDSTALIRMWEDGFWGLCFAGAALAEQVKVNKRLSNSIIDELFTEARTENEWKFRNAISILGQLRSYLRAGDRLSALARDEMVYVRVRERAAEALWRFGRADEAASILLVIARGEKVHPEVRVDAAEALGHLGRASESAAILLALAYDEKIHSEVRVNVAVALGHLGRADDLLALARDEKLIEEVRLRATDALSKLGRADCLLALACDEKILGQVRVDAAAALGRLGQADKAAPILLALGRDEGGKIDEWARERAAAALGKLGQADVAVPILRSLACDQKVHWQVRGRAAEAMGQIGRINEATLVLLMLIRDEKVHTWVRMAATESLGRLRQSNDLLALARDEKLHAWMRVDIAALLSKLGWADEAIPILLALMCNEDKKVNVRIREHAAETLGQFSDANVIPALERIARKDTSKAMRQAAQRAIKQIRQRT